MRMRLLSMVFVLTAVCWSCLPQPSAPEASSRSVVAGGTWVVCEGLWRQDNATLSYVLPDGIDVIRDAWAQVHPSLAFGDTASDIVARGDTMYIAVNTSRKILMMERSTGRLLRELLLPLGKEPYRLALADDSTLYCSNLNDDTVTELDATTLDVRIAGIVVGPAPEGIDADAAYLVVANSGLGDLRATEAGAGTVGVYDRQTLLPVVVLPGLVNVSTVRFDRGRRRLWVSYRHLTSKPDSLGGIVCYDVPSFQEIRRWRLRAPKGLAIDNRGEILVLHTEGVARINALRAGITTVIPKDATPDIWYALAYDGKRDQCWVGNARGYVTDGEVLQYDLPTGNLRQRFAVGLNPTAILPAP